MSKLNPWNYKPWWCQPWSILLTGILIISGSWILTKIIWLTVGVSMLILIWWVYFLILWPRLIRESGLFKSEDFLDQSKDDQFS